RLPRVRARAPGPLRPHGALHRGGGRRGTAGGSRRRGGGVGRPARLRVGRRRRGPRHAPVAVHAARLRRPGGHGRLRARAAGRGELRAGRRTLPPLARHPRGAGGRPSSGGHPLARIGRAARLTRRHPARSVLTPRRGGRRGRRPNPPAGWSWARWAAATPRRGTDSSGSSTPPPGVADDRRSVEEPATRSALGPSLESVGMSLPTPNQTRPTVQTEGHEDLAARVAAFREQYVGKLAAPHGWWAIASLDWLEHGESLLGSGPGSRLPLPAGAPERAALLTLEDEQVVVVPLADGLELDGEALVEPRATSGVASLSVPAGETTLLAKLIRRGDLFGVRVYDPRLSAARDRDASVAWFEPDPAWVVVADFVPPL